MNILLALDAALMEATETLRGSVPPLRRARAGALAMRCCAAAASLSVAAALAGACDGMGDVAMDTLLALSFLHASLDLASGKPQAPGALGALLRILLAAGALAAMQGTCEEVEAFLRAGGGLSELHLLEPTVMSTLARASLVGALYLSLVGDGDSGTPRLARAAAR